MKTISGYKAFYIALDQMEADMEKFRNEQPDEMRFWATRIDHETNVSECKPYKDNVFLWRGVVKVNGGKRSGGSGYDAPCVFMWRTTPSYMTGKSSEQIMKESETEKVLHIEKGYEFCIVRDRLREATETHWGKKFIYEFEQKHFHHKMVIRKKGKVLFECFERWEFTNFCEGAKKVEYRDPETPTEIFRYFNPFRLLVVPFTDKEYTQKSIERYGSNCGNEPSQMVEYLKKHYGFKPNAKKLWVVHLMGMGRYTEFSSDKHITTWWIMESNEQPSNEDALYYLMNQLELYDRDNLGDVLQFMKDSMSRNMNDVNYVLEERIMDLWKRKVVYTLERLMDTSIEEIKKFWNENQTRYEKTANFEVFFR